jgi:heme A synthase
MNKDFGKLCTPAKIYFVIAVFVAVIALFNSVPVLAVFVKLLFAFIWTYILSWLCKKGYQSIAWLLVLLPYIIIVLGMIGIYHITKDQQKYISMAQMQGPIITPTPK